MCFVDFDSAFDSVDRDSLWRIMAADGIPPKLLRLIKAHYSSTKIKVRATGSDSMSFEIRSGVRQGCALSHTHFNYTIDWILGQALQDYPGVQVGANIYVSDLAYADDIVKFKYLGSTFVANGKGTEEIRSRIHLAGAAFSPDRMNVVNAASQNSQNSIIKHRISLMYAPLWGRACGLESKH